MIWWQRHQLQSKNPAIRLAAVESLAKLKTPKAVEPLLDALAETEVEILKLILKALASHKDERIPGRVLPFCGHPDPALRTQAVRLLEQLGWRPTNEAGRAWLAAGAGDLRCAALQCAAAIPVLKHVIEAGPAARSVAAIESLSVIGGAQALPPLEAALRHRENVVRTAAVEAIGRIGERSAVALVLPLLKDPEARFRTVVVEALGRLGGAQAGEELVRMLEDASWEVRRATTISLGGLKETRGLPRLVEMLNDPDRDLREATATALGNIGDERGVGPLVLAQLDPDSQVRRAAEFSLGRINRNWAKTSAVRDVLPELQQALKHHEDRVRQSATKLLNQMAEHHPDLAVRAGLQVDRNAASGTAVATLLELLRDADADVRFAAVEALGTVGDERAMEGLEHALLDADTTVQFAAARALEAHRR